MEPTYELPAAQLMQVCVQMACNDIEKGKFFILVQELLICLKTDQSMQAFLTQLLQPIVEKLETGLEPYILVIDLLRFALLKGVDCTEMLIQVVERGCSQKLDQLEEPETLIDYCSNAMSAILLVAENFPQDRQ